MELGLKMIDLEVEQINNIPAEVKCADKIIWIDDEKGDYSVKNCYKRLMSPTSIDVDPFSTKVWKMRLPPKIKSFLWQVCS
nr:uncharacterized protein LOC109179787 [Ipomoea batatas]